jgi:hypothetical protein
VNSVVAGRTRYANSGLTYCNSDSLSRLTKTNLNQCSGVVPCERCSSRGEICAPQPRAGRRKQKVARQPPAKATWEGNSPAQSVNADRAAGEPGGPVTLRSEANDSAVRHHDNLCGSRHAMEVPASRDANAESLLPSSYHVYIGWNDECSGDAHYRCDNLSPDIHAETEHVSNRRTFTSMCRFIDQLSCWPGQDACRSTPLVTVSDVRETLPAFYRGFGSSQSAYVTWNDASSIMHEPIRVQGPEMSSFQSELERPQYLENCGDMSFCSGRPQVVPEWSALQGGNAAHVEEEPFFSPLTTVPYAASDLEPQALQPQGPHEEPDMPVQELFSMPNQVDHDSMTVSSQPFSLFDTGPTDFP